jgi:hypothetical protein
MSLTRVDKFQSLQIFYDNLYSYPIDADNLVEFLPGDCDSCGDVDFFPTNNYCDPIDADLYAVSHSEEISFELRQCAGLKRTFDDALEDFLPCVSNKRPNMKVTQIVPKAPKRLAMSHFRLNPEIALHNAVAEVNNHLKIQQYQSDIEMNIQENAMTFSWTIEMKKKDRSCEYEFHIYEMSDDHNDDENEKNYIFEGNVLQGDKSLFYANFSELKSSLAKQN